MGKMTADDIDKKIDKICAVAGFDRSVLTAPRQTQKRDQTTMNRWLIFYLLHVKFAIPQKEIADRVHNDRSSIIYGIQEIEEEREKPDFDSYVEKIERQLDD